MNKLTKKDICDKWLINKTINPLTMRKISETGAIYKKLEKSASYMTKLPTNFSKSLCKTMEIQEINNCSRQ